MLSFLPVHKLLEGRDHTLVIVQTLLQYHRALCTVRTHRCWMNWTGKMLLFVFTHGKSTWKNINLGEKTERPPFVYELIVTSIYTLTAFSTDVQNPALL